MIRKIKESDRAKFVQLNKLMYSSPAVSHSVDESHFERTFDELMKGNPYVEGVMIECDDKVVGYGLLALSYSNEAGGMQMVLDELYIEEPYRNRGLGREFFDYAEHLRDDIKRFRLEVVSTNRAKHLYSRLGYEELDYTQMIKDIK